ncbi:MAG TPA: DUF2079 domain-containing protein [bacterium]|nr:DUF2079 domain-containing protein [bacterium]
MESTQNSEKRATRLIGAILVGLITIAFGVVAAVLLRAKWNNYDPFLLDFAKTARFYEALLQRVPYEYPPALYAYFYSAFHILMVPIYALTRSIFVIFVTHLLGFTLAIPVLYLIARRHLPGIALPLAMVVGYTLNPTLDIMTIALLRIESLWVLCFLLAVYCFDSGRQRLGLIVAVIGCLLRIDGIPIFILWGALLWSRDQKALGKALMKRSILVLGLLLTGILIFRLVSGVSPNADVAHMADFDRQAGGAFSQYSRRMIAVFTQPQSYANLTMVFQFLLLPLLAPLTLVPLTINVLYIVISSQSFAAMPLVQAVLSPGNFLVPFLHPNDTFLLAVFFVASVYGLKRLTTWIKTDRMRGVLAAVLIGGFFAIHWFFATPELGPVPLTRSFNYDYYRMTSHARSAHESLAALPMHEAGLIQSSFAERNWQRPRAREIYPTTLPDAATQYILMDLFAYSTTMSKPQLLAYARTMLTNGEFRVESFADGILYLRRGTPGLENAAVLEAIAAHENQWANNFTNPYRFGELTREEALARTFSPTMLPENP